MDFTAIDALTAAAGSVGSARLTTRIGVIETPMTWRPSRAFILAATSWFASGESTGLGNPGGGFAGREAESTPAKYAVMSLGSFAIKSPETVRAFARSAAAGEPALTVVRPEMVKAEASKSRFRTRPSPTFISAFAPSIIAFAPLTDWAA